MTTETLSDMIFQDRLGIDVICAGNVKDFIQKLKDECSWCQGKGKYKDFMAGYTKCHECEKIDKLAGHALVHSPSEPVKDTPDVGLVNVSRASGTQSCAKCGHDRFKHFVGGCSTSDGINYKCSCKKFITDNQNCTKSNNNQQEVALPVRDKELVEAKVTPAGCDNKPSTNKEKKK